VYTAGAGGRIWLLLLHAVDTVQSGAECI
jgi:hypothetical protein